MGIGGGFGGSGGGGVVGDPIEQAALAALGWRFDPAAAAAEAPPGAAAAGPVGPVRVAILRRFPFSAETRRMAVSS